MLASTKVLDALKNIGLNLYERRIYTALLAKGVSTPSELSEIANVPRSRSYDILQSLAEKGFVIMQPSRPIKYVALAPADAIEKTKEVMEKGHQEMLARIDSMRGSEVMKELETINKQGIDMVQPHDLTGTLKGSEIINRQLKFLFGKAGENINIVTTKRGLSDLYSNHFRALKKSAKSGVRIKIAAPFADDSVAKDFSGIAELRHVQSPSGRVITVDNKHIVTSLADDSVHETQDMFLWANSPHAVKSLGETVFVQAWKSGEEIKK